MDTPSVSLANSSRIDPANNQRAFSVEVLDYIPILSIVSGLARFAFGELQMASSAIQDAFSCFYPSKDSSVRSRSSLYLEGKANAMRGAVAITPILGNISLYFYDRSSLAKNWERRVESFTLLGL
jgi:hypothetical protein